MLLLDERITADGKHAKTWASWSINDGERLQIRDDDGSNGAISLVAVDRVMRRYGRPLDQNVSLDGQSLRCAHYRLSRLRHHSVVDAEARDYLVWQAPDDEPVACIATTATAVLRHLIGRLSGI
jgi:hypothetical protein